MHEGTKPDLFTGGHRRVAQRLVKNTRRRPAGNTRMNDGRNVAFGERESRATLV
jgi:hypothetical protein